MNNDDLLKNKSDNNKVDALYKIWLGKWFRNIIFMEDNEIDVKATRSLLDELSTLL
jgi:hypothetical protein